MRTRIALATAMAVITIPLFLSAILTSTPAAGAASRTSHSAASHRASSPGRARHLRMKLASDEQASKLVAFADAVETHKIEMYLEEAAYLKAVAANTMPAAWQATATCEEGGRDDPTAGYFGILEWNGFDGYPTAGSAPLSVQLAWEARYIGSPPDAPGQCHGY